MSKILLLGETGAGKSTVINMIANYFLGGSITNIKVVIPTKHYNITERAFQKHSESNLHDSTKSQTSQCSHYSFRNKQDGREFTLIDTPGLSDTNGVEKDEENLQLIMEAAEKADGLSALVVVVNGTTPRLTTNMKNVFERLKGTLPDVFFENIILILTNCLPHTKNFNVKKFKAEVVEPRKIFHMQNSAFSIDMNSLGDDGDEDSEFYLKQDWNYSMTTIESLITEIKSMKKISTSAFKEMREARNTIMAGLSSLLTDLKTIQDVEEKLDTSQKILSQFQGDVEKYKDYIRNTTMDVIEKVATTYHNTVCLDCAHSKAIVCHEHCGLNEQTSPNAHHFAGCACFGGSDTCRMCECGPDKHYHAREKYVKKTQTVEKVLDDIKKKHDESVGQLNSTSKNVKTFQGDLDMLKKALINKENEIDQACQKLKQICSGFNFVNELCAVLDIMKKDALTFTSLSVKQDAEKRVKRFEELVDRLTERPKISGSLASGSADLKRKQMDHGNHQMNVKKKKEGPSEDDVIDFNEHPFE